MKSLLITAAITTFVLALFFHSGSALVCYNCPYGNCDKNITCTGAQNTCLIVHYSGGSLSRCWWRFGCNVNFISTTLKVNNFNSRCCN